MKAPSRREFTLGALSLAAATSIPATAGDRQDIAGFALVHHVLFWLNRPDSRVDRDRLIDAIRGLGEIPTVRAVHVGIPAATEARDVVDHSWSVSEILCFDDEAGQAAYQAHPLHLDFVEKVTPLIDRVVVYDTIAA